MLISGGLFLIAALAIIGVFLLVSAEVKSEKAKAAAKATAAPSTSVSLDKDDTQPELEEAQEERQLPQTLLLESGEIDSLAAQIRQLHQQSRELEQRLAAISALTIRLSEAQPVEK